MKPRSIRPAQILAPLRLKSHAPPSSASSQVPPIAPTTSSPPSTTVPSVAPTLPSIAKTTPPTSQLQNPSSEVPSSPLSSPPPLPSLQQKYDGVVRTILSVAPTSIRNKFEASRDPRLLFSYAPNATAKTILSSWLDANYFIPKEMATPDAAHREATMTISTAPPVLTPVSDPPKASMAIPRTDSQLDHKPGPPALRRQASKSAMDDVTNKMPLLSIRTSNGASSSASSSKLPPSPSRDALTPLLEVSNQAAPFNFDSFLTTFQFEELHDRHRTRRRLSFSQELPWRKIGEASFSEVFSVGQVVLKIIPLSSNTVNWTPSGS